MLRGARAIWRKMSGPKVSLPHVSRVRHASNESVNLSAGMGPPPLLTRTRTERRSSASWTKTLNGACPCTALSTRLTSA